MWINKKLGRVIAVTACVVSVVVGGASIGGAEQVGLGCLMCIRIPG